MECSFWLPNKYVSFLDIDILLYVFFYFSVSNYVDTAGFILIIKFYTTNNSYLNFFMDLVHGQCGIVEIACGKV